MENILLRYCRETNNYSFEQLAAALGINTKKYIALEQGDQMPDSTELKRLSAFYKADIEHFYDSVVQFHWLRMKEAEIVLLKSEIENLKNEVKIAKKEIESLTGSIHDTIRKAKKRN